MYALRYKIVRPGLPRDKNEIKWLNPSLLHAKECMYIYTWIVCNRCLRINRDRGQTDCWVIGKGAFAYIVQTQYELEMYLACRIPLSCFSIWFSSFFLDSAVPQRRRTEV